MEVYHNGQWGTVCDSRWDLNDAEVVCSELGYGKATAAIPQALHGKGSGQIWFDNVNCVGTEQTIRKCSYRGWRYHHCSHRNDASVRCSSGEDILINIMVN